MKPPDDTLLSLTPNILDIVALKVWAKRDVLLGLWKQGLMLCRGEVVTVQGRHFALNSREFWMAEKMKRLKKYLHQQAEAF